MTKNKITFSLLIALSVIAILGITQIVSAHSPPQANYLQLNNSEATNQVEDYSQFYDEMNELMDKYGISHPCHAL